MLAADMLSFENEPTAVLRELRASGMALPLLDSPHVMQAAQPRRSDFVGLSYDFTGHPSTPELTSLLYIIICNYM